MSCASCVARAERALTAQAGVQHASVNLGTETAVVVYDAPATAETLAAALAQAGYPARQRQVVLAVEGMTCAACTTAPAWTNGPPRRTPAPRQRNATPPCRGRR
eukprot:gene2994-3728_t